MTSETRTTQAGYLRPEGHSGLLSDPARLAALTQSGLVGSAPEQVFDDLVRLAASTTGCAVAAITLVGETTTYWKSVPNVRVSLAATQQALADSRDLARSLQDSLLPPLLYPVPGTRYGGGRPLPPGQRRRGGDRRLLRSVPRPRSVVAGGDRRCLWSRDGGRQGHALARYTLRADAGDHLSPAAVLDRLNAAMLAQRAPRFLTAAQVTLRLTGSGAAGRLCLAGHPPVLVRRTDGVVRPIGSFGSLLGVFDDIHLSDVGFRMKPADLLLLYTDGATEARSHAGRHHPERRMLDQDGFARLLETTHGMTAAETVDRVAELLAEYQGGRFTDDTALLALRIPPDPRVPTPVS